MPTATVYVSAENREMSRRFDTTLEHVQTAISALAVANTLHISTLTKFCQQTELLFLPNVRHGVISIPNEHRGLETIPMVIAKPGEKYAMDDTFADHTPSQLQSIIAQYADFDQPRVNEDEYTMALSQFRKTMDRPSPTSELEDNIGAITEPLMLQEVSRADGSSVTLMSRPLITLNGVFHASTITPMLAHEFEHIKQFCASPFYDDATYIDQLISDELASYDEEAPFARSLINTGNPLYDTDDLRRKFESAKEIANLCDLNPADDRYAASQAVKRAIKVQKLGYIL